MAPSGTGTAGVPDLGEVQMRALPLLALLAACGGGPKADDGGQGALAGAGSQRFDLNRDGIPDVWKYLEDVNGQPTLVRKDFDINFDGRIDIWRSYEGGRKSKDRLDMDFDGRVDVTVFYDDQERVVRKEVDVEFDEKPDLFKHYSEGQLVRVETDSDGDGRIDFWEHYKNGRITRQGSDEDGDGEPDPERWVEIKG